jgi:hypothetical protein
MQKNNVNAEASSGISINSSVEQDPTPPSRRRTRSPHLKQSFQYDYVLATYSPYARSFVEIRMQYLEYQEA